MTNLANKKILIVDDEEDIREILVSVFKEEGALVMDSSNGKDALSIAQNFHPDLVISDIRMPGGSGIELLEKIKTISHKHPPVILITGDSDLRVENILAKGADVICDKPLQFEDLIRAAKLFLGPEEGLFSEKSKQEVKSLLKSAFESISMAKASKNFAFGRKGFFVKCTPIYKINEHVAFHISFAQDKFNDLQGEGIVRWIRNSKNPEHTSGLGVEILYLEEESRKNFIKYISNFNEIASIPLN